MRQTGARVGTLIHGLAASGLCLALAGSDTGAATAQPPPDLTTLSIDQLMDIEVVYGASKYEQKTGDAPASVSIVTAEEIKRYGYRTLGEILAGVRGFYATYDRNYTYLGVRGFARAGDYNSRVLLLVDGHRSNDIIFGQALLGTEGPIDVELIDRVEVIRGPSSSIYGTGAFFGVVSVITKQGKDLSGTAVSAAGASYSTRSGRVAYGTTLKNGADLVLGASVLASDGRELFFKDFDTPATNNGLTRNDDDEYHRLFAKVTFGNFRLEAAHSSRRKGVPTASFNQLFNDTRAETTDERSSLEMKYERAFSRLGNFTGRAYLDRYYYFGDYPYDAPPVTLYKDFTWGYWWGTEGQVTLPPHRGNRVTSGFEFHDNYRQDLRAYDVSPYFEYYDRRKSSTDLGVYLQDEIAARKTLTFNLGLRYDYYTTFGDALNPRVSIIYSPRDRTTLKALYGTAFRAPNAYELYYNASALGYKPPPGLAPESISTTELVLEQYVGGNLRLSGSLFHNSSKEMINLAIDPLDNLKYFDNLDRLEASGVEFELQRRWARGWEIRFSSAYQTSRAPGTPGPVANSPHNLSKLNLFAPFLGKRLAAGLEMQYTSSRHTVANTDVGGFLAVNLTLLSKELAPGLEISATVSNLLDKRYADP
ncbi:MAG TPA: TonB-dependent receptor, partial [Candidatus Polarisedimenticolia bacterium]|nr:TonB-dependent receptor [Candidatus Polarisedimenticolia bacterium]